MPELVFTRDTLRQRDLEAFSRAYRAALPENPGRIEERGATVRAAAAAGWFGEALTAAAVDDLPPRIVDALAAAVNTLYEEATTPDPKA